MNYAQEQAIIARRAALVKADTSRSTLTQIDVDGKGEKPYSLNASDEKTFRKAWVRGVVRDAFRHFEILMPTATVEKEEVLVKPAMRLLCEDEGDFARTYDTHKEIVGVYAENYVEGYSIDGAVALDEESLIIRNANMAKYKGDPVWPPFRGSAHSNSDGHKFLADIIRTNVEAKEDTPLPTRNKRKMNYTDFEQ